MSAGPDRRVLLARFANPEEVPMLTPADEGEVLLWKLLYPFVVDAYLPAARPWPDDTEDLVHDVRVACRRLAEALDIARPLIGNKRRVRAKNFARGLRRALGAGREADVMMKDLVRLVARAGLTPETLATVRFAKPGNLDEVRIRYPPELLLKEAVDVLALAANGREGKRTFRQIAGPHLARRARETRPLIDSVESPDRLDDQHDLRIRFKRLRYSVETIAPAFGEVIDKKVTVKMLKGLQDALGDLNDIKDLRDWLGGKQAKKMLGTRTRDDLAALANDELAVRRDAARALVLEQAPPLVDDLIRAAGRIGPLA